MKHILLVSGVLFLSACGGGGGSSTPTPESAPTSTPQATASIVANPTTVLQGDSVVISWNSSNASSCTASGYWSGTKSTSGNETVEMTSYSDQSFTITCGSASATATVQVNTDKQVVRRNRLNLLNRMRSVCLTVADLSRVEG